MNSSFYKIPFVFITILIVVGIDFQSYFSIENQVLWVLFIIFLMLLIVSFYLKRNNWFAIIAALLFLLIGSLMLSEKSFKSKIDSKTEGALLVKIHEIGSKDKLWRKAICELSDNNHGFSILNRNKVLLFFESSTIQKGDVILVSTDLSKIENKNNPGEFNAEKFWSAQSVNDIGFVGEDNFQFINHIEPGLFSEFLNKSRSAMSYVLSEHLEGDQLGIASALIIGDKGLLSKETKKSFSSAGAMHVLAVSGLHVGIVLVLLMFFFSLIPRVLSRKRALVISLIIIWFYAGVTGFSPSVLRATIMFTILSSSILLGRKSNNLNTLFFSAFLMLVWNPLFLFNIGFQLSYLAMIGIFTLHKPISRLLYFPNTILRWIWKGTSVGIAAQIATFPLTLFYFHQFPNFFMVTNIGMMLLAGICLSIGLGLFIIHKISFLSAIFGGAVMLLFSIMLSFVQYIERTPGALAKGFNLSEAMVLMLYACMLFILVFRKRKKLLGIGLFSMIILISFLQISRFRGHVKNELVIYNSNKLVLSINDGKQIHCFYDKSGEKKVARFIEDYEKLYPGDIHFHILNDGVTKYNSSYNQIELNQDNDELSLKVNNEEFCIRKNYRNANIENVKIIDMPYLQENPNHIQLRKGAFRLNLN